MSHIAMESVLVLLMLFGCVGGNTVASINGRVTHLLVLLNPGIIIHMLSVYVGFVRCSSDQAGLVLPHSHGLTTCSFERLHDFLITVSRCIKVFYVNSFFIAQCSSLIYDLTDAI